MNRVHYPSFPKPGINNMKFIPSPTPRHIGLLLLTALLWLLSIGCAPTDLCADKACESGQKCLNGQCTNDCPAGESTCNQQCTNLQTNPQHCGKCGQTCTSNQTCTKGQCTTTCTKPATLCGNTCVALSSSPQHCGKCGNTCQANAACYQGACVAICATGETNCDGRCVKPDQDPQHCGRCDNACPQASNCLKGTCQPTCNQETTNCSGTCVNTKTSHLHCGACNKACQPGQKCQEGVCVTFCSQGFVTCDEACVDITINAQHCGKCKNTCQRSETCQQGQCKPFCQPNQIECSKTCVDSNTNPKHCGTCDKACLAGYVCAAGKCVQSCPASQVACDGGCHDLSENDRHCGKCGVACKVGTTCQAGVCKCDTKQTLCNGACVDLTEDKANCSKCGVACKSHQICQASKCVALCKQDETNCSESCVDLKTDDKNCGACGNACSTGLRCKKGVCTSMWAKQVTGRFYESRITVGASGSVFICGYLNGKVTFGSHTTNNVKEAIYVAKLGKDGVFQWVKTFDSGYSWCMGIKVDTKDNVYISGSIYYPITFGTKTITPSRGGSVYVAKLDATGKVAWAVRAGGTDPTDRTNGFDLAIDKLGNSYIAGSFGGACTFGTIKLSNIGASFNLFVAKLDTSGVFQWATQSQSAPSPSSTRASGIAIGPSGNIYITGRLGGITTLGSIKTTGTAQQFVAKLSPQGTFTKVTTWPGIQTGMERVKVDKNSNVYLYFPFHKTLQLGTITLTAAFQGTSPMALVKMDSTGKFLWAKQVGGNSYYSSLENDFTLDVLGRIHVIGRISNNSLIGDKRHTDKLSNSSLVVATFDSKGNLVDYSLITNISNNNGRPPSQILDIVVDQQGNTYVIGYFEKTLPFLVDSLTSKGPTGSYDLFIAKNLP